MVDRSDTSRENTTSYAHPQETNLLNVHKAMEYNLGGEPVLRTTGSSVITNIQLPPGFGEIHKFGAVPAMSVNTEGTIWDENDTIYPWATIDADGALTVTVVEPNNENNASIVENGATIEIQGLDDNYELQTETVTISGSSATTVNTYKRVFRAIFTAASGFDPNTKRILIKSGVTTVAKILEGNGQTLMAIYTIPAGKTGYLMRLDVTASDAATGEFKLMTREGGTGSFNLKHVAEVNGRGGAYQLEYPIPQQLPEKTDVDARIITFANNGRYTCTFDILLVDN